MSAANAEQGKLLLHSVLDKPRFQGVAVGVHSCTDTGIFRFAIQGGGYVAPSANDDARGAAHKPIEGVGGKRIGFNRPYTRVQVPDPLLNRTGGVFGDQYPLLWAGLASGEKQDNEKWGY